jgi:hypothetical protein
MTTLGLGEPEAERRRSMPRPERPVDPSAGPIQQFATALRKLRTEAGNPPYREMVKSAHASKASLSAAASGQRMPTWEVTREYVRACGGDVGEWHERWTAVRAELGLAAPPPAPRRRRVPLVAAGAVVLVLVALAIGAMTVDRDPPARSLAQQALSTAAPSRPAGGEPASTRALGEAPALAGPSPTASPAEPPARFDGGQEQVADNADPKKSGCADDPATIVTLDKVQVNTLNENLLGDLVLRHAPGCHASWGRFEPSNRLLYLAGPVTVTITAHRPATGTVGTPYTTAFDGQPVFGNILLDRTGCIEVSVQIDAPAGDGTATTHCKR